jgi:hypothetical protein
MNSINENLINNGILVGSQNDENNKHYFFTYTTNNIEHDLWVKKEDVIQYQGLMEQIEVHDYMVNKEKNLSWD